MSLFPFLSLSPCPCRDLALLDKTDGLVRRVHHDQVSSDSLSRRLSLGAHLFPVDDAFRYAPSLGHLHDDHELVPCAFGLW